MKGVRMLACIQDKDRELTTPPPTYQHYILPEINYEAKHYMNMVKFHGQGPYYFKPANIYGKDVRNKMVRVTCPPILKQLSREEIVGFIRTPLTTQYLCHSQPCERGVKNTSEAVTGSTAKMTHMKQLGQALLAEKCRSDLPCVLQRNQCRMN